MRYTRKGGLRSPRLARLTNGRIGLGRWTAEEVARIEANARRLHEQTKRLTTEPGTDQ